MYDDLHTPVVLAGLSDPLKSINDLLHTRKGKKQQFRIESLAALKKSIGDFLSVLGLMPSSYYEECLNFCALNRDLIKSGSYFLFYFQQVLQQLKEKALKRANVTEDELLQKIEE
ncbi:cysteine--tRNA ligase, chloroplastic/mitochondrial [Trifolium repens]|nr:cysteine--tRNA ligase, chloroplastic/mitochondrial [Trifolium repens]